MPNQHRPVTIAVAGGTGSGKTTIANAILEQVGSQHIAYLPHDAYYKNRAAIPLIDAKTPNFDHPDAIETALMIEHIRQLQRGEAVNVPVYDFTRDERTQHS